MNTPTITRPQFSIYHPNGKGTGAAIELELHPAHDRSDGSIMMKIANQMTIGDRRGPNPTYPHFDWKGAVTVKLDFNDLSKILQVFRGECEAIDDGHGLYHSSARATTKIVLRHLIEPVVGYSLEVYRILRESGEESRMHIVLNPTEALGLCEAIAGSLSIVCFGIPMVIRHEASTLENDEKEKPNAAAA